MAILMQRYYSSLPNLLDAGHRATVNHGRVASIIIRDAFKENNTLRIGP